MRAREGVSASAVAWALVGGALAAFAVALVRWGAQPFVDYPMVAFALTALVAAVTVRGVDLARVLRWRLAWAVCAFLAWALVSALASGRVFSAIFGSPGNMWGWLTLVGVVAIAFASTSRRSAVRDALVKAAPWVVVIQSVVATWQWTEKVWPAGTFSNPTYMVMALGVLLPFTAVVPEGASAVERRLREAALVAGLWCVGLSGSRVGFVAVAVWAAVALWTGGVGVDLSESVRRWALGALVVIAVPAGVWTYRSGGVGIGEFIVDRAGRLAASWGGMMDRPLTGWGPDGFGVGAAAHVPESLMRSVSSDFGQFGADPHNLIAWIAVSTGVVGLALFGWMVFEVARNWSKQASAGRLDAPAVWAVGLYGFQAMFAPAAIQTLALALLALGSTLAIERASAGTGARPKRKGDVSDASQASAISGRVAQVALALCAVLTLSYAIQRATLKKPNELEDPLRIQKAAEFWSDPYLWYHADLVWGWAIQRNPALQAGLPDLVAAQRAADLEPGNPVYLTDLARAKAYWGLPEDEVKAAFEAVYRVFPRSPDAHAAYAEYLIVKGDVEGAWRQLEPVENVSSQEVWRVLVMYYEETGQGERAEFYGDKITAARKAQPW